MEPQLPWSTRADGIEIKIRVTPRGGRDAIEGVEALSDGRPVLKVRVRAPPEDGAANEGIRRLLAKAVRRPPSAVALTAGATARVKTFAIEGDPTALAEALATAARMSS